MVIYPLSELRSVTCICVTYKYLLSQVDTAALIPAKQAGTRFTYAGWMKG